ncbi:tetratricopeptide repeat protein, partial [candidate division CSSED10-310 bacterium]
VYPEPQELPVDAAQFRLFNYLFETLKIISQEAPLILILDDLQWADELAFGFFEFVLRADLLEQLQILFVGTYRSEAVRGDLINLTAHPKVMKIDLSRLSEDEITIIVSDMLAMSPPPCIFCRYITRHSEGNPLFIAEYLRAAVADGLLKRDEQGIWQVDIEAEDVISTEERYEALAMPASLQGLIKRRLAVLSAEARALLKAAAVVGREAELSLINDITAIDDLTFQEALEELLQRQIFEIYSKDTVRFLHEKIREVTLSQLDIEDKQRLHGAAALGIEKLFSTQRELYWAVLGRHWQKAGELKRARACYLAAAKQAVTQYDHEQSEQFYSAYLNLTAVPSPESVKARNEFGSKVLRHRGSLQQAREQHEQAVIESRQLENMALQIESLGLLAATHNSTGQMESASQLYEQALNMARTWGDRLLEAKMLGGQANVHFNQGSLAEAHQLFKQAIAIAQEFDEPALMSNLVRSMAVVYDTRGNLLQARQMYEQDLELCRKIGDRYGEVRTLSNLTALEKIRGHAETLDLFKQALELAREIGDRIYEINILANLANYHQNQCHYDQAQRLNEQALTLTREIGNKRNEGRILSNLAGIYGNKHQHREARELFEQALSIMRDIGDRMFQGTTLGNLGILNELMGCFDVAEQQFDQALASAREVGNRRYESIWLLKLANLYQKQHKKDAAPFYNEALDIAREVGDPRLEASLLNHLASFHLNLGHVEKARHLCEQALSIVRKVDDKGTESLILLEVATIELITTPFVEQARAHVQEALVIQDNLKVLKDKIFSYCLLGHCALAQAESAQPYLDKVKTICDELSITTSSDVNKVVSKLKRAFEVFLKDEHHQLFRGRLIQDIPPDLRHYLEETGQLPKTH